jgi:hypothetical protein
MVPKSCATYEGLNVVSDDILADHFNIARFSDRQDPGYFQLVGHLSRMSRKSQSIGASPNELECPCTAFHANKQADTEAKVIRNKGTSEFIIQAKCQWY